MSMLILGTGLLSCQDAYSEIEKNRAPAATQTDTTPPDGGGNGGTPGGDGSGGSGG